MSERREALDQPVTVTSTLVTQGRAHWALTTQGLSPLGYELALRVAKGKDDVAVPEWAHSLLLTLVARAKGGALAPDTNQVMLLAHGVAAGSELSGLVFTPIAGALLVVPVTRDEAKAVREWSPSGLVEVLSKVDPQLVTDLDRPSLLQSPRARVLIEQRMELEGSSMSSMTAELSHVSKTGTGLTWKLSPDAVETLVSLLKGRTGHLRPFSVVAGGERVDVVNADAPSVQFTPKVTTLRLSLVAARQLRALLRPRAGNYTFEQLPGLAVQVP